MKVLLFPTVALLSALLAASPVFSQDADGAALHRSGVEAIAEEDWDRASQLLEAAYEASPAADRSRVAFNWGFAVYQRGQSLLRGNPGGDTQRNREGIAALERALLILELTTDARAASLREAIRRYLAGARTDAS